MSLKDDVVNLLRSREAQSINFRFGTISIYGSGYGTIASAIETRHIMLENMVSRVSGALLCEYCHSVGVNCVNRLLVDEALDFNAPVEAQLVIHEATHAVMDYQRTRLNLLESEATAYIAGAFYCVLKGVSQDDVARSFNGLSPSVRDEEMIMVYSIAYGLAHSIARTRGGYAVARNNVDMLKQTIARTQLYRRRTSETVGYDGI
jgi:hypothetical protein